MNELSIEIIVKNIRSARISKNLSQRDIAPKMGMTQQAYSKIEAGKVRLNVEFLLQLSKILEVDFNIFFSLEKQPIEENDQRSTLILSLLESLK